MRGCGVGWDEERTVGVFKVAAIEEAAALEAARFDGFGNELCRGPGTGVRHQERV